MGQPLPNPQDRRVLRTRRALREALVDLLAERGWDGFTVQDICDRADVGRSTFYLHFADKEELVGGSLEDLGRVLRAHAAGTGRPLAFTYGLIEHALDQRRLFLVVVGKESGHVVQRKFRAMVLQLVGEDLAASQPAGPHRDAVVAFLAGALLEFLAWALESRTPLTAAELDAMFHRLAGSLLAA